MFSFLLELASEADAIYRMDGMGLISRDIFEEYLRQKHSDKMEEKCSIEMQPSVFLLEKEFI